MISIQPLISHICSKLKMLPAAREVDWMHPQRCRSGPGGTFTTASQRSLWLRSLGPSWAQRPTVFDTMQMVELRLLLIRV